MGADRIESQAIKKCLLEIEASLGWGPSGEWHNDVFSELSTHIQNKTQVLLSPTTLKRVWGKVNYNSAPSISTLNALSNFIEYENWRDFKVKHIERNGTKRLNWRVPNKGIFLILGFALALILVFSMASQNPSVVTQPDSNKILFSSQPVTKGMPNSVIFDFDISTLASDSIFIQQFWDPTKTIKLKQGQKQATGIYYQPGYFRSKLISEGQVLKEHDLFIASEGWLATINYEPIPKYIDQQLVVDDRLSLSDDLLMEVGNSEKPLTSTYHFVGDLGNNSGDDFQLKTNIQTVYREKWAVCQQATIVLLGKEGAMLIPFSLPGCVSDINLLINDVYINGKENDLSAFGTDLSKPTDIEINVSNKHVTISINASRIYEVDYQYSTGELVGLRYIFLGAGEVHSLDLATESKRPLLSF